MNRADLNWPAAQPPGTTSRSRLGICVCSLAGFVLWFLLDAAVFRSDLYPSVLEPESSAGNFELLFWNEVHREPSSQPEVVAIGHSRLPFLPRVANELTPPTGYRFANAGVAGTSPRCWYYLLRDLDPTTRRYTAIVFALDDYDDEDIWGDQADNLLDLHKVVARLRWSDVLEFSGSFRTAENRWQAFRGSLFKGFTYKRDFYDFLLHPLHRIAKARWQRRDSAGWFYGYTGEARSLEGLRIDWTTRKIQYPDGMPQDQRELTERILLKPSTPHNAQVAAYRRYWFGKIVDRYRSSNTRIVFLRLPRGPIPPPPRPAGKDNSSILEIASRRNVILCDEHTFDSLERPELFMDPLHMNGKGMRAFSVMMADLIVRTLGPAVRPGS